MLSSRTNFLVWQLLVAFMPAAWAATATCAPGWEWASNSKGQNPCQIAGNLQAPCLGYVTYELGPLKSGSVYTAPGKTDARALKCGCNTVIYSLYSACEACQNASTRAWGQWNGNCDSVYVAQYPFDIPGSTAIPKWAFINITEEGSFDASAAQNVGRDPESHGNVPVTLSVPPTSSSGGLPTSSTAGRPSVVLSSGSPTPSSTTGGGLDGDTSNAINVPAIVGGVIGGVVSLVSLSLLLFWLYLRRRRGAALPYTATRALSHRTLSTRSRGSYYPPSFPVHNYSEIHKRDWRIPEVYSRSSAPPQEERMHSPTGFDARTSHSSPLYPSGGEHNIPMAY